MISNILKGAAMGVAEVIPGVSGGTIAFITGIYERLLNAIKAFSPALIGTFRKEGIKGLWAAIDGTFLLTLVIGMMGGIVIGAFGVSYLLEEYPPVIWAFFFGLIIASAIYIGRQIEKWSGGSIGIFHYHDSPSRMVALVACRVYRRCHCHFCFDIAGHLREFYVAPHGHVLLHRHQNTQRRRPSKF